MAAGVPVFHRASMMLLASNIFFQSCAGAGLPPDILPVPKPPIWIGAGDTCTSGSCLRRKTFRHTCGDDACSCQLRETRSARTRDAASRFERTVVASSAGRRWKGSTFDIVSFGYHEANATTY